MDLFQEYDNDDDNDESKSSLVRPILALLSQQNSQPQAQHSNSQTEMQQQALSKLAEVSLSTEEIEQEVSPPLSSQPQLAGTYRPVPESGYNSSDSNMNRNLKSHKSMYSPPPKISDLQSLSLPMSPRLGPRIFGPNPSSTADVNSQFRFSTYPQASTSRHENSSITGKKSEQADASTQTNMEAPRKEDTKKSASDPKSKVKSAPSKEVTEQYPSTRKTPVLVEFIAESKATKETASAGIGVMTLILENNNQSPSQSEEQSSRLSDKEQNCTTITSFDEDAREFIWDNIFGIGAILKKRGVNTDFVSAGQRAMTKIFVSWDVQSVANFERDRVRKMEIRDNEEFLRVRDVMEKRGWRDLFVVVFFY